MARTRRYLGIGVLTGLAIAAMAWSAFTPESNLGSLVSDWADGAFSDMVDPFRTGPVDGYEDWQAASQSVHDGNAERGAEVMALYGCGGCHVIPGITGARGTVGPNLAGFAERAYVGGVLPNTPGGLVRWLVDPPKHAPETAMPDLDVTEADARDMAAYLYTLKGDRG